LIVSLSLYVLNIAFQSTKGVVTGSQIPGYSAQSKTVQKYEALKQNSSQIFEECQNSKMVSRNCTTSMSFRGNKKNNKPSRIVGHGLHYSTDKQVLSTNLYQNANSTHHSKNKSVLEKIKVGGKCIFKSQGIKDLSALRYV